MLSIWTDEVWATNDRLMGKLLSLSDKTGGDFQVSDEKIYVLL